MRRKKRARVFLMEPEAYLNDPAVLRMSTLERGAYSTLLMALWNVPEPGVVDDDDATLRALSRCTPEEWEAVRSAVSKAFDLRSKPGLWIQKRMVREYRAQSARYARLIEAGRKGGKAKWDNEKDSQASTDANGGADGPAIGSGLPEHGTRDSVLRDKTDRNEKSCAPQSVAPAPDIGQKPIFQIPLNGRVKLFPIYSDQIKRWRELYPAVDIDAQIRRMIGWSEANPRRRKTMSGALRFIDAWLSGEQNKAQPGANGHDHRPRGRDPYLQKVDRWREDYERERRNRTGEMESVGEVLRGILKPREEAAG